jgi:hypothetical protein
MNELEDLVLRLRALVRETALLREAGASNTSLSGPSREIECLKSRLADVVKQDPTMPGMRRMARRQG